MALERNQLLARVRAAVQTVRNPRTNESVLDNEQIQNLTVDEDSKVHIQFLLKQEDPGTLVREVRAAAEAVEGVARVKIDVKLPNAPQPKKGVAAKGTIPAPTPDPGLVKSIKHVIAVSSGKGGVGKSTVAANLAAALASMGRQVGVLDADVYGPDIPLMFGETRKPRVTGEKGKEKIVPLEQHGVKLMSLGFLLDAEQPAIMRGPLIAGILKQFLEQVEWGELDYLIVDMPPGTGDAQLSLVQTINLDGAVMVTTPQDVSTGDVRRAIRMFERVNTRVIGVVENMGGMDCPHCGQHVDVFGHGGGKRLAHDMHVPFLGEVPLDPNVRIAGDAGSPTTVSAAESPAGNALREIAEKVATAIEGEVHAATHG
ncbi:MAG: Mrp/NBP35 family ATP-binding protein [Gemmatimonadota bacterium]